MRTHVGINIARCAFGLAILAAWWAIAEYFDADFWISSPRGVAEQLRAWADTDVLWSGLRVTMLETILGFLLGSLTGAFAGFLFGAMPTLGRILEPFIVALYTVPKIALAPLFILWFGIGMLTKVMFAAVLVFFLVFFTTFQGARSVEKELLDVVNIMGAGRRDRIQRILIPNAAVWMFSGLKLALPYALIGAVVGEFFAATEGIGFMIRNSSSLLNTDGVFAGLIVLLACMGVLVGILSAIEHRVLRWKAPTAPRGIEDLDSREPI